MKVKSGLLALIMGAVSLLGFPVVTTSPGPHTIADLKLGAVDAHILTLHIDSDTPTQDFTVEISSDRSGWFVRLVNEVYQSTTDPGNGTPYTVTLQEPVTQQGSLGCDAPTLPSEVSLASPIVLSFNNCTAVTDDYQYEVLVDADPKPQLFHGDFQDEYIFTVEEL